MMRTLGRAAAGALLAAAAVGCEASGNGNVTGGADLTPPRITISAPGATNDTVNVSEPLNILVSATDNLSLRFVSVQVEGGAVPLSYDTTFSAATPGYSKTLSISLTGLAAGDTIVAVGIAQDGARNFSAPDTLVLYTYDPQGPTVTVTQPASGSQVRAGQPLSIGINAVDGSGVVRIGWEILQISATGLETIYAADSADLPVAVSDENRIFAAIVPDTLQPTQFRLRGFATDLSGNRSVSPTITINVLDAVKPGLNLISPPADTNVSLGSDLFPVAQLTDNVGVRRLSIVGIATRGDPNLGIVDTVIRYDSVFAPINVGGQPASFRTGLRDTTITRLMRPKNAADTVTEFVTLIAKVTDVAGNDSIVHRRFRLVSGPRVLVIRPGTGAVAARGKSLIVELRASDKDGVRTLGYRVTGAFTVTRSAPTQPNPLDTLTFIDTLVVPTTVPQPSEFTISPFATDDVGQPGSGPSVVVSVLSPASDVEGPVVYQALPTRIEVDDSVSIRAIDPSGVQTVGFTMYDEATGSAIVTRDSIVGGTFTDIVVNYKLDVPAAYLGRKVYIISKATDTGGNVGYSIPTNTSSPVNTEAQARPDTTSVVFGQTYALPQGGLAADIMVDTLRQNAYVSNITFDRLEVWEQTTKTFASKKIAVGADPWGLFVDNSGDTLLVANSAGTNLSRVFIGSSDLTQVNEVAGRRIKTTETVIYDVKFSVDAAGVARYLIEPFSFSDRPQYVAQALNGEIFYSTKPTPTARPGTIRRYDPNHPVPESQTMWQYGRRKTATGGSFAVINSDGVFVKLGGAPTISDSLIVCDHVYGQDPAAPIPTGTACFTSNNNTTLINALRTYGSDVEFVGDLDVGSLALTDTTFVAASGDRQWIAFGEGNTNGSAGRVFMTQPLTGFFSSGLLVKDLTDNASEVVFGIAINKNSTVVGTHGRESYFAEIQSPFHLRLQGKVNTFDLGAGIAFHPDNMGDTPAIDDPTRTAFVASSNGTIEIVDSFHYTSRGSLPVRANLYGPIRVTNRFPTDDPSVVLKVFGLTTEGFVVIDVRATDIKPLSAP